MELAAVGPRPVKEYVQTLHDSLELVGRMRLLVEALRELVDIEREQSANLELVCLDTLLCDSAQDLTPVAKQKGVNICIAIPTSLPIVAERRRLEATLFRFLEAALSLAEPNTAVQISTDRQGNMGTVTLSWHSMENQDSPLSPPELGLLLVQAAWERMGGLWSRVNRSGIETCSVLIAAARSREDAGHIGESK
ncbi:MAG TPA: hypothetical protein VGS78_11235 [Candidatus Sulfotelmatobacter sp.]|nr:hypothetical protein [Candidatus Sulfotelmatobacter sp.]